RALPVALPRARRSRAGGGGGPARRRRVLRAPRAADREAPRPRAGRDGRQAREEGRRLEVTGAGPQRCFIFFIASRSLLPSGTPRPVTGSQPLPALKAPLVPWMTSKKADGLA